MVALARHLLGGARSLVSRRDQREALQQRRKEREAAALGAAGGSPNNPIVILSPAVVEPRAESMRCTQCSGPCRLEQHTVEMHDAVSLRVAHLVCQRCAAERTVYFRLQQALPN